MKQRKDRFAPDTLDEQLAHLTQQQATETSAPEQRVLQELQALYATGAERERRLLERVRKRLAIPGAQSQSRIEQAEVASASRASAGRHPILLPAVTRRRRHRLSTFLQSLVAVFCVGLLVASFLTLVSRTHRSTTAAPPPLSSWQVVSSPHLPSQENHLWGVSASAAHDVWAVGESFDGTHRKTLIEHWDGQHWRVITNPNPGVDPTLEGVTALSPDDAWAVGGTSSADRQMSNVLIEHWNGSQWSVVSAPNPGSGGSSLWKVSAVTANDVWAVGDTVGAGGGQALIEHWDGEAWSVIANPSPPSISASLRGITVISATDIWAVGFLAPSDFSRRAFIEHWDGNAWKIVTAPDLQNVDSQLFSVSAASSDDVWAVGTLAHGPKPLIEHWDGAQWSASPIPSGWNGLDIVNLENSFDSVLALNAQDVWALGSTNEQNGQPVLLVHWDGLRWSIVQGAQATARCQNELLDLAAVPASSTLWAVGDYVTSACSGPGDLLPLLIQPLFEVYAPEARLKTEPAD